MIEQTDVKGMAEGRYLGEHYRQNMANTLLSQDIPLLILWLVLLLEFTLMLDISTVNQEAWVFVSLAVGFMALMAIGMTLLDDLCHYFYIKNGSFRYEEAPVTEESTKLPHVYPHAQCKAGRCRVVRGMWTAPRGTGVLAIFTGRAILFAI